MTNRIALVKLEPGSTFASNANPVAASNPAAILLITAVESATAVVVVGGIPTFTIGLAAAEDLLDRLSDTDDNNVEPPNGAVSRLPLRIADTISLAAFQGVMAGFSSRGPNDHPNARFRVIKPDVTAPGAGIFGAATPTGLPDDTVGLASLSGYTTANGTSFSGPITAGAISLVRQRVRENLNLDTTDLADPQYRTKRFDTVTVARALLQNSATNLRSGLGQPQGDGASSVASVNEMGSGHINVAGALSANAIMVSPTALLTDPAEFTADDPIMVLLPTVSFGQVPVVGVNGTVVRTREVIIRSVTGSAGAGTYNLTVQNNRPNPPNSGFAISFRATANSATPITSVTVPAGGQTSFFVRVDADGAQITSDPTEFQWYVSAAPAAGQTLRMPFYYRAVRATIPNITAPEQQDPQGTEQPPVDGCFVDTNGSYSVRWNYTVPGGGPLPVSFRVQEATRSDEVFFDPADEPLVAGENDIFAGSEQWTTQVNPETGSPAYFIPDTAEQNESLTMVDFVNLPPGGATLSFLTNQDTELDFDFANVDISTDGVNYTTLASFSGLFVGTRFIDISPFAGGPVKVRFRMTSDMLVPGVGWYVEDIRISSDDFATVGDTAAGATSLAITGKPSGTYTYRIAGLFDNPLTAGTTLIGPYSNLRCVTVQTPLQSVVSRRIHGSAGPFDISLGGASRVENRVIDSAGNHTMIFTFANPLASVAGATVSGESGSPAVNPAGTGIGPAPNQYTVKLTAVNNAQTVTVTLSNVQLTGGGTLASVTGVMDVLRGDTSGDGVVNSADVTQTRRQSGQLTGQANFRVDMSIDGVINSADVTLVRRASGTALP